MTIEVHSNREVIETRSIADLYESVGFGTAADYLKAKDFRLRFVDGESIESVFAIDENGKLVGMARALTDHLFVTYLAEMCVHPSWQRQGIGKRMLVELMARVANTAIYTDAFSDNVGLYASVGIAPKPKLVACSKAPTTRAPATSIN